MSNKEYNIGLTINSIYNLLGAGIVLFIYVGRDTPSDDCCIENLFDVIMGGLDKYLILLIYIVLSVVWIFKERRGIKHREVRQS